MISYGFFHWFSFGFDMLPVDFDRRPSPDLWLSYDSPWFCYVFAMFPVDFNRRPSPDLRFILWFPVVLYGFLWFCFVSDNWFSYAFL